MAKSHSSERMSVEDVPGSEKKLWPATTLTTEEAREISNVKIGFPRKEYARGDLRLNFEHVFSTGEVFKATEDGDGWAKITIEKDHRQILDFSQFLPQDYRFITPTHLLNKIESITIDPKKIGNFAEIPH